MSQTGPERGLRAHRAEQSFQSHLDVGAPGHGRAQVEPQPREAVVRPDRLEPDGQQELRRHDAGRCAGAVLVATGAAERLDRPDPRRVRSLATVCTSMRARPALPELRQDRGGHQQHRVAGHRRGGKRQAARHVGGRCVREVARRQGVDVDDLAAGTPVEQRGGQPRLLLQLEVPGCRGGLTGHRVQLPEHAAPAPARQVVQVVQREARDPSRHRPLRKAHRRPRHRRRDHQEG